MFFEAIERPGHIRRFCTSARVGAHVGFFVFAKKLTLRRLQEAVQLFFEAKGYKLTEEDGLRLLVLTADDKDSAVSLPAFTPKYLKAYEAALEALTSLLPGLITDLTFEEYLERYEKHFGEVQVKAALLDFSGQLELCKHGS